MAKHSKRIAKVTSSPSALEEPAKHPPLFDKSPITGGYGEGEGGVFFLCGGHPGVLNDPLRIHPR